MTESVQDKKKLFEKLLEMRVFKQGSLLKASYPVVNKVTKKKVQEIDVFKISKIHLTPNVNIVAKKDGTTMTFDLSNVVELDGMSLERLAETYDLKMDGTSKPMKLDPLTGLPVRRGRKSKKELALIEEMKNKTK